MTDALVKRKIRSIVAGLIPSIGHSIEIINDSDSLIALGMDSSSAVKLLITIEAEFCIVIPDGFLTADTLSSVNSLAVAVAAALPQRIPL